MADFYESPKGLSVFPDKVIDTRNARRPRSLLTMEQRLLRIRDDLLALMHAYYMPLLIANWITYRIGHRINVGFFAHSYHISNAPYPELALSVYVDSNRYFEISWEKDGPLHIRTARNVAAHEHLFKDIRMLKRSVKLEDQSNAASEGLRLGSLGEDAWTKKRLARMRRLRDASELHARSQEEAHYLMRDLERAEAWGGIAEAIRFGAAYPTNTPQMH